MNLILLSVVIYVVLQIGIGVYLSRSIKDQEDYILAGRQLGITLGTFTIFATWFGSETCIGSAGRVYEDGLYIYSAEPFGYGLALLSMGIFLSLRYWNCKLTTLGDLFKRRYSLNIERLSVFLMLYSSLFWAAAQVRAFGQVLSSATGFPLEMGITLATLTVVCYTFYGGLKADTVSDLIQGIVLIVGLLLMLGFVLINVGGPRGAIEAIDPQRLQIFSFNGLSWIDVLECWAVPICGSVVAQELVGRVIAIRTGHLARRCALSAGVLYLCVGLIPVFLALIGSHWYPNLENSEQILPLMAKEHLPLILYVIFIGAIISAILSTIDTTLLVGSSLISQNIILPLYPQTTSVQLLRLSRWGVVVLGLLAFLMALQAEAVIDLVLEASATSSAGIFTVVMFALFTRFGGPASAAAGMIGGIVSYTVFAFVLEASAPFILSMVVSTVSYVLFAWIDRGENQLQEA